MFLVLHCDIRADNVANPRFFVPSPLVTGLSLGCTPHLMFSNSGVNSELIQTRVQTFYQIFWSRGYFLFVANRTKKCSVHLFSTRVPVIRGYVSFLPPNPYNPRFPITPRNPTLTRMPTSSPGCLRHPCRMTSRTRILSNYFNPAPCLRVYRGR